MGLFDFLFGAKTQEIGHIKILNVDEFKSSITQKKVQLVDVRTSKEYRSGHISNALNIDFFQQSSFKASAEKLDKKAPIYLYCRSGNRSQKAAKILSKMGFEEIYDLKGGYMAWY
ncbi:rhodanese-like domain-containing protein [Flagellimonas sp. 389]|uniref:rhodanese-like domain-containing protein n=1 Tax=Flagellimonas sp. 389 TaxID=2835862 RepID=UPI001BD46FCF|nr:rhodanese-like domain-containing protein [Flagellimonas sp. 389]MBS9462600.1 rhodanese-like domain-containing protein [Flagellimonas sp. 389]